MSMLGWREIRENALAFSKLWDGVEKENAESQTFWNEFLNVFGINRRVVNAVFEESVKSIEGTAHRIDLFWPGRFLAEHKSRGADLSKAQSQAFEYIMDLDRAGRHSEIPRFIAVSDFARIVLYDLEPDDQGELFRGIKVSHVEIPVDKLHEHVSKFGFLIGQTTHHFEDEDPANLEAAQIMADLHDEIAAGGYDEHQLERLMVRLLFCMFAEDTGIFDTGIFQLLIENQTKEHGEDLGPILSHVFQVLNTPEDKRNKNLPEHLQDFPYVNGELFAENLGLSSFTRDMRNSLLAACRFDWSKISPAIFGSLFQGIMDPNERRQIGAHYTSERDIMKVIRPLFLDDLKEELKHIQTFKNKKTRDSRLREFQAKLAGLNLLDPACGCGNFLVIAYRELRRLELDALKVLHNLDDRAQQFTGGEEARLARVDVDQFYGIEIGEWPARIAETALWLTDHQMNQELSEAVGNPFMRIPLKASPHIQCANALRIDWNDVLPADECSYVLGNPPFSGAKYQDAKQKSDVKYVAGNVKGHGLLDFVTMWYFRAVDYVGTREIPCAFVSTNSITQGEQVGILWGEMFARGFHIHFAHRTFSWTSEAKGKAHVHVVIIGFGRSDRTQRTIYEYETVKSEPIAISVSRINGYLVDADEVVIMNRTKPICDVPAMSFGNQPIDGGNLLLAADEYQELKKSGDTATEFVRRYLGAVEFINGYERWCLWLNDATPEDIRNSDFVKGRVKAVKEFRLESKRQATRDLAVSPYKFAFISHRDSDYLMIPSVSSERRDRIPIGFMDKNTIASNLCMIVPCAEVYHFGVLTSAMHMAWVRQVCGRLKSDFRYSAKLVYNNFPWPESPTVAQVRKVEECAQGVLDTRKPYLEGGSSFADLYDPLTMPGDLLKAHQALDRAVDKCYRGKKFDSERERVEFLFGLYEKLTAPLAVSEKPKRKRRRKA